MNGDEIVSVWRLADEAEGILLQNVLNDEGILSKLRSEQIPWMNGIMKLAKGYWGDLMVLDIESVKAGKIIQSYLGKYNDSYPDI